MELKNLLTRPDFDMKKIVYVDMDGVIVDLEGHIRSKYSPEYIAMMGNEVDTIPELFDDPKPVKGAIDAIKVLAKKYDVYFLSTAPWDNPRAWMAKRLWIEKYLGEWGYKRLILSHHKGLCKGDYLIDDRKANGVESFDGVHIHFGTADIPDWDTVLNFFNMIEE